jgi:ABC-type amino acid transport substrate-binding protein
MLKNRTNTMCVVAISLFSLAAGCAKTVEIRTVPTTLAAIGEMRNGLADAVVGDYPVIAYQARESAGALVIAGPQFNKETIGIAVAKSAPELNAAVTDALRKLMENKAYMNVLLTWALPQTQIDPPKAPAAAPDLAAVPQLKDGELKVGMELSYAPMEFFDEFKHEAGVDVDLARALGQALGVKVVFVDMPFDALLDSVETGKVDVLMSTLTVTDERAQRVDFIPYLSLGSGILVEQGNPAGIEDLVDLCGHVVAVQGSTAQLTSLEKVTCTQ